MSGRGYELPDGYYDGDAGAPPPQQYQDYGREQTRRPVAPYARRPGQVPPQTSYQDDGGSYAPYRAQAANSQQYEDHYDQPYDQPRQDPFADPHSSENLPAMESQRSLTPQPPRHGAGRSAEGVGYGMGNDNLMPGGRLPYRADGYDEHMDPWDIADDPDEISLDPPRRPKSRFGMGAAAAGAGAAVGLQALGNRDPSGNYGPIGTNPGRAEKSQWLQNENRSRKKRKWIILVLLGILIVGAIAGGLAYYFIHRSSSSSGPQRGSASDSGGLWGPQSSQVQAVLNNKNLHRVFPGMDYTPLNAQYPDCLTNPPFQNDVTLDVAVLAQLTPAIRLYGTDCKQTEMVLKGIDILGYNDTVKVWLGVYLDANSTTNERQLSQMYDILDTYPASHFAGVIVGNEVLFSKYMTEAQLGEQITTVRQKLAAKGINLPVSTADLGDNWTAALAEDSDIIMSNVHPFFAGVTPQAAPAWTLNFWNTHDVVLSPGTKGNWPANIISETGWPSQGGNDCGTGAKCTSSTEGAIAGISEMNDYMDGWVCQRLEAGTTYFWFEAFDEPWKVIFDDPKTGDFWEPHWGLMDVNRNLKSGLKIPDCGGKTVDKPY